MSLTRRRSTSEQTKRRGKGAEEEEGTEIEHWRWHLLRGIFLLYYVYNITTSLCSGYKARIIDRFTRVVIVCFGVRGAYPGNRDRSRGSLGGERSAFSACLLSGQVVTLAAGHKRQAVRPFCHPVQCTPSSRSRFTGSLHPRSEQQPQLTFATSRGVRVFVSS